MFESCLVAKALSTRTDLLSGFTNFRSDIGGGPLNQGDSEPLDHVAGHEGIQGLEVNRGHHFCQSDRLLRPYSVAIS
jgi:hypothetical protein